ncbi:MAG: PDZ domain-containing protein, partial [Gaiellales bacterium]
HPATSAVHVPGGRPPAPHSGFYFVDVSVLQANLVQKYWAEYLVDGADLLPASDFLAPGQSEHQRVQQDYQAMTSSQQTAQVVAERALGKPVPIIRRGALVSTVEPGLPAARAGVKPGDVITRVDGRPVHSATDLIALTRSLRPGDRVTLTFLHAGTRTLTTVESRQQKGRAIVGISISDAVKIGRIPIRVRFTTPGIGGPSAGLAFALEIYDSLSGRTLLHGHRVAVTGELDLAGGVHTIGGVKQKTIGAIEAGADVFLVPAGQNFRDARAAADGRIRVVGVRSFSQALSVLKTLKPV